MCLSNGNCIRCTLITSIILAIVCTKCDNYVTYDTPSAVMGHTKQCCLHQYSITHPTCGNIIFTFIFYYNNINMNYEYNITAIPSIYIISQCGTFHAFSRHNYTTTTCPNRTC